MAWCHQATSHYLSQCWPRTLPPYGVTRPQWVKYISIIFSKKSSSKYTMELHLSCLTLLTYTIYRTIWKSKTKQDKSARKNLTWSQKTKPFSRERVNMTSTHFMACILTCLGLSGDTHIKTTHYVRLHTSRRVLSQRGLSLHLLMVKGQNI